MNLASTLGREPPFSILACIFALMSSTELGPFGVLGVFSCFLKDSCPFDLGVDEIFFVIVVKGNFNSIILTSLFPPF